MHSNIWSHWQGVAIFSLTQRTLGTMTNFLKAFRVVAVAQLLVQLVPSSEVCGSNQVIDKFDKLSTELRRQKMRKRGMGRPNLKHF